MQLAKHEECTGCSACSNICPMQCLKMEADENGFLYPVLTDESACINCLRCEKVCPILVGRTHTDNLPEAFAAYTTDDAIRSASSSGGLFTEIAKTVLKNGGVVYGAAYDSQYKIRHISVEKEDDLSKLRGAKYSQSVIGDIFRTIKSQLDTGRQVLFSGTPCQVAGLKNYLQKDYQTLVCIDFICHGVPSPMAWSKYVKYRSEQDNKGKLPVYINLRSKESGWSRWSYSTLFEYGEANRYICKSSDDIYMKLFVGNYILRESCENCRFKGYNRMSDITLGDFWGIWDIAPQMDDNKGTSVVLTHTNKGMDIMMLLQGKIIMSPVTLEQACKQNSSMLASSCSNKNRDVCLKSIREDGFENVADILTLNVRKKPSIWERICGIVGRKTYKL